MRYKSYSHRLKIFRENGEVAYAFSQGELTVGDPTLDTAGNAIDPNASATDGTKVQILGTDDKITWATTPGSPTALERVGLLRHFWQAPPLTNADAIVVGTYYEVLTGEITHDGTTYVKGDRFKATDTAFTGSGVIAFDVPAEYYRPDENDLREEHFRIRNLGQGDEATYDKLNLESEEPTDKGWFR